MYHTGELIKFSPFYLDEMGGTVERFGQIDPVLFQTIKDCLKKARLLRRKYRKLL